jgi:hypothetical protein
MDRAAAAARARDRFPGSAEDAVRRAASLLDGRYDLLGYSGLSFRRDDIDVNWHFDPVHGRQAPVTFWAKVPYLDPHHGDHKIIWELNRHQHWLALGRAAWLTGDRRYVRRFVYELESWLTDNPPLTGINWASMLELALRSISWIWALHFFAAFDDEDADPGWLVDLLVALDAQLQHITRHLSFYFSPNTHLLGEGLALFVAGRVLPELRSAARWEAVGRRVLIHESTAQVNADGGHAEQSTHYHRYALDFYLLALAVARATGDADAGRFAQVATRLASFCRALADDHGQLPTIGDDDGGMLFPICGRSPADAADSLALAAVLLNRPELAVGDPPEEVFWMLGGDPAGPRTGTRRDPATEPGAHIFRDTGYVVLRSGVGRGILDAGRHGFLNGGHAHADALSLVLSVHGRPLLVDPGTGTYTMDSAVRDRFRSTEMHNTAVIDSRWQSEPAGPFDWRTRAQAQVDFWRPGTDLAYVEAAHDGYRPVVHRRAVLAADDGLWLVADHILGSGHHRADTYWHLDPAWTRNGTAAPTIRVEHGDGLAATIVSTAADCDEYCGDTQGLGWCAPVYGRFIPSLTLRFGESGRGPFSIVTAIAALPPPVTLALTAETVEYEREDGWHRAAVSVKYGGGFTLVLFATPARSLPSEPARRSTMITQGCGRVRFAGGTFITDARMAMLRLSPAGEPFALDLIDTRAATWTGRRPFDLPPFIAAQDLHMDRRALRRLSRGEARPAG